MYKPARLHTQNVYETLFNYSSWQEVLFGYISFIMFMGYIPFTQCAVSIHVRGIFAYIYLER